MDVLVTGGLGFIGSALVRRLVADGHRVVNLDRGSYSSTSEAVAVAAADPDRYLERRVDLCDLDAVKTVVDDAAPQVVMHLAAESHVDRSIDGPLEFVASNVTGTANLLEALRTSPRRSTLQQVVHVSTDEVFGSLALDDPPFDDSSPLRPRSPYAASKAASDLLALAWSETYGLPVSVTNCSNNYGPFQFPEKLIPLMTIKALRGEPLPLYGDGSNVRDWLHVEDHVAALVAVMRDGAPGERYTIGGGRELSNLELVGRICDEVDRRVGDEGGRRGLITFVEDRPAHDLRYAIDDGRLRSTMDLDPVVDFDDGLADTIGWILDHESWWTPLLDAALVRRGRA